MNNKLFAVIALAVPLVAVGCGSDSPGSSNNGTTDAATADADTTGNPDADIIVDRSMCTDDYPIVYAANPALEALALTALSTLAPNATMTWSAIRGTFKSVASLDIPITSCADDSADLHTELKSLVEANPVLFQMDTSEWNFSPPAPCSIVGETTRILPINRHTMAGKGLRRDVMSFVLARTDGQVVLRSLVATYLPVFSEALQARLAICPELDLDAARTSAFAETYGFQTFFQCTQTGVGEYPPTSGDTVHGPGDSFWTWFEDSGQDAVVLNLQHSIELQVAEPNITAQLLESDANCPSLEDDSRVIGFSMKIDVVTNIINSIRAGIDCIVC